MSERKRQGKWVKQDKEDWDMRKRECNKRIRDFSRETTAHGFGRAANAKSRWVRLLWIILLVAAAGLSFYHIGVSIRKFAAFPARSVVKISAAKESVKFPGVTVCNVNEWKASKTKEASTWISKRMQNESNKTVNEDPANKRRENLERVLYYMSKYSSEELKKFGHQGEDMIVNCQAPGRWAQYPCDSRNFTWFHDKIHGNCFTFNAASYNSTPIYVEDTGHRLGFHMTLYVESEEYWAYLSESLGFLISIHDPEEVPFPEETGYFIAPGTSTSIALQSKLLERLPWPYDGENCEKRRKIPPSSTIYSEMTCRKNCVAQAMLDACKCVSLLYRQKPSCNPFNESQDSCVEKVLGNRNRKTMEDCKCPPACVEERFSSTISSSIWPTSSYLPTLMEALQKANHPAQTTVTNLTTARENMANVMVYFSTMTQESIVQKPAYQIESLLGDIGGQMGLFIGISVLTLVEFIALMWELFTLFFFKSKSATTQVNNSNNS